MDIWTISSFVITMNNAAISCTALYAFAFISVDQSPQSGMSYWEFCVLQILANTIRLPSKKSITVFECSFAYILPST